MKKWILFLLMLVALSLPPPSQAVEFADYVDALSDGSGAMAATDRTVIVRSNVAYRATIGDLIGLYIKTGSDGTWGISMKNNTSDCATASGYDAVYCFAAGVPSYKVGAGTLIAILVSNASGVQTFLATPTVTNFGSMITGEGTGVISAMGNNTNATNGFVTYSGNIGAAAGTSLALTGNLTGLLPSVLVTLPSGTDSASTGAAFLTHADDSSATGEYIGLTLYNVTDGSSCTVTASTNTTTTCTLAGGAANHWDSTNVYQLGPGPSQSGSMFYVTGAGNFRWPSTVGYGGCIMSNGTANVHVVPASASMTFKGTLDTAIATTSAGHYIESSGSTGDDFMCLHNISTTVIKGLGKRGTWAKEADD